MINFMNDYNSPGHPAILKAVTDATQNKYPGYATDDVSERARRKIAALLDAGTGAGGGAGLGSGAAIGGCDAEVHFLAGGTQVNLTAISAFLRPHEAVIAAGSSHIQVHETGAIEATGHRILLTGGGGATSGAMLAQGGKLTAGEVRAICRLHDNEHMVKPRLVYISQSTELGGVYTLAELQELRVACDALNLFLYMDGARLGAALTAPGADARLPDIAALCDAFYIGGTKNGLLFGEALVIMNDALKEDFRYLLKQRGGMLAKGFLLGIQFEALFENNLFYELADHANKMAERLRDGLEKLGYSFYVYSPTNQIFPIIRSGDVDKLGESFLFETWEQMGDGYAAVRFVTSWNTTIEEVDALLTAVATL